MTCCPEPRKIAGGLRLHARNRRSVPRRSRDPAGRCGWLAACSGGSGSAARPTGRRRGVTRRQVPGRQRKDGDRPGRDRPSTASRWTCPPCAASRGAQRLGSWCPPCRTEAPDLQAAATELKDKAAFVGINIRDRQGQRPGLRAPVRGHLPESVRRRRAAARATRSRLVVLTSGHIDLGRQGRVGRPVRRPGHPAAPWSGWSKM